MDIKRRSAVRSRNHCTANDQKYLIGIRNLKILSVFKDLKFLYRIRARALQSRFCHYGERGNAQKNTIENELTGKIREISTASLVSITVIDLLTDISSGV